jgi:hypothetical protein
MTMVRVETAKIAGLKEVLLCWNSEIPRWKRPAGFQSF